MLLMLQHGGPLQCSACLPAVHRQTSKHVHAAHASRSMRGTFDAGMRGCMHVFTAACRSCRPSIRHPPPCAASHSPCPPVDLVVPVHILHVAEEGLQDSIGVCILFCKGISSQPRRLSSARQRRQCASWVPTAAAAACVSAAHAHARWFCSAGA